MITKTDSDFSGLRSFLWPIHRHEIKKVIPMTIMLVLICLNYSILRNLKDIVVVTAQSSGAEVIPFIKVWVMLPMAFLTTYLFTKLNNWFSQDRVFFIIISSFLLFYVLFVFFLYPARDIIHPHEFAQWMGTFLPKGFRGLVAMVENWSFTLFYVMCELWGTIVLTVLFWGFANEVTKIGESRRFYSVMGIGSNIAAAIAGQLSNFLMVDQFSASLPYGTDAWEQSMINIVLALSLFGFITIALFWWMNKNVLNEENYETLHTTIPKPKKKKLSLSESFSYLSQSKYL
ncbi:MAG: NTP/NDP exchange transporter, partial [Microbacteriaceae bacterium]|nr:NTP/NDP exchange transporter [Microbacteriaceae bacterium]